MAKSVFSKEEADHLAIAFTPQKFPHEIKQTATAFVAAQALQSVEGVRPSFRIDRIVAQQTGIAELERLSMEEKVEKEALIRLQALQEQAYQEAYQLGLEEGREKAFNEHQGLMLEKIEHLGAAISAIENLKPQLISANENHIVRLVYYMARRIAMGEIKENRELILNVVRQAIESAQTDETVTVRVSTSDYEFVESVREKLGKEFEAVKNAKLESSADIQDGGCIVETNYGDVDSTIEQRFEKVWNAIAEKMPQVKTEFDGSGA